jgi:hypothetical protein
VSITATSLIHTCTIQRRYRKQKLTFTGGAGAASAGQTVTGGTSHATAVIDRLATAYLIVKTVSGIFSAGEALTTPTWSGTLGTQTDYSNQSNEPEWYWKNDQLLLPCNFYFDGSGTVVVNDRGERTNEPLKLDLNPTVTIDAVNYRITSTEPEFTGIWIITALYPATFTFGIHHYELTLKEAT